ncbi:transketolase family protein [Coprobacter secundus]|uniref:transketolase n=1 Tax=Coprobacter secundus subsp. similis TaxID=2751153 RepID=A0A7G1HXZ0_9BACT|nr:transketolase [Coprobacter secundus]BCI64516.1 transketolase [Coprobacter secundus subsp. similis]
MNDTKILNKAADNIRILAASMVEKAKSGHPGGAMGGADFVNTLFAEFMVYDPSDGSWINRDRFFLDPGHMSPMLYGVLTLAGKYTLEELKQFRQWGSSTPGHPEADLVHGIENTSGPLGQGHTMAVGAAIAERFFVARFGDWMSHKTYAFISDGGIQEEISQGAGRIAGFLGLSNLIMFYDSNDIQLSTDTDAVTHEDTAAKYRAWNWNVLEIDGNNADEIRGALLEAQQEKSRPTLIIGKTIMGKGAVSENNQSYERKCSTHGQPLTAAGASISKTIEHLGGNPEEPFVIFPEVQKLYAERRIELEKIVAKRKAEQFAWEKENPEKAILLHQYFSGKVPDIDYKSIVHKPDVATRVASSDVLGVFGEQIGNMIVSSADLANSDKTDGFLKKTHAFINGDFTGAFLQAGVSELTMAAIMNGMALHGGIIPACGTFFVFSDYMKPAVRLAALMEVPVKYVWTHDAFRVGEDGPTHQPVEQEAQIRLLEQLKNHHGRNSVLVLRPADSAETTVAWKLAMENIYTPTALILSRQNVKDLPAISGDRYQEALQAAKGAYIIMKDENPDVVLVANGSEVSTLVATAPLLRENGIKIQIVSAPSEGLFFNQSKEYQESVIPSHLPVFGLTAGLPSSMYRLVGKNGVVWGLDHFGNSAPYKVLDEKFGFTTENVLHQVKMLLNK